MRPARAKLGKLTDAWALSAVRCSRCILYIAMKRTQLYLDDDIANILSTLSRQRGTTISSLVRECIREKFGPRQQVDKAALAREVGGIWKKRTDLGGTARHVRKLRKGRRLKNLNG
jgi:hypothetical protein